MTQPKSLSLREKFGYGLGDMASNIVYQAVINVLMYFYTDIYGIEAAAAGTLMILVRIFDAITDPIMGAMADRTRTRWGRYRPWLLWGAIPFGVLAVAAFITPNASAGAKLAYAYLSYALLMTAYTVVNILFRPCRNDDRRQGGTVGTTIVAIRHGHGGRLSRDGLHLAALPPAGRRRQVSPADSR